MTKQRPDASGMLLLLEFSDEDAQLVPKGHIFTMDLGHCMAFNGIGNLMEKLSRIYDLWEGTGDCGTYKSVYPVDDRFFFAEKCLESRDAWQTPEATGKREIPSRWKNCMMIWTFGGGRGAWQGVLIDSKERIGYKNAHELSELFGRQWLKLKSRSRGRPIEEGSLMMRPDLKSSAGSFPI